MQRTCQICGLEMKGFFFNAEDGKSTKEDGVPHLSAAGIQFCPLADDHSIYYNYLAQKREAKKALNSKHYAQLKGLN